MKSNIFYVLTALCFSLIAQPSFAQGTAGSEAEIEPRYLIDFPTAGALKKGTYTVESRLNPGGGVGFFMNVGMSDRFSFGVSFGGANVIGNGDPGWFPQPGMNVRYRMWEETEEQPAVVVGLDMQGQGAWIDSTRRYLTKSPGVFVAASKNYAFMGFLILNGGLNYSLEREDGDNDLNFYVGIEKTINSDISALFEYNFATNDNGPRSIGKGNGYFNAGLRWSVGSGLTIEFDFKNLTDNIKGMQRGGRSLKLEYSNFF